VRVIEIADDGHVVDEDVPAQFDRAENFDAATRATGTVVFLMKGNTAAGATSISTSISIPQDPSRGHRSRRS
jgi:hypothetical protein